MCVSVAGRRKPRRPEDAARWIERFSDHAILFFEVQRPRSRHHPSVKPSFWRRRGEPAGYSMAAPARPVRMLVSEVMFQQTQVARVVPRFEAWMERWPTVESLAGAGWTT